MARHTVFLCYVVALVKWKHRLTADNHRERLPGWLCICAQTDQGLWGLKSWDTLHGNVVILFHRDFTHYSKRGSTFIPECPRHGTVLKIFLHKWSKCGIPQGDQTTVSVTASKPTVPEWMGAGRWLGSRTAVFVEVCHSLLRVTCVGLKL